MARDEHLPIPLKLKRLTVILADQVAQPRLREPNPRPQLRSQHPLKFLRRRVEGQLHLLAVGTLLRG